MTSYAVTKLRRIIWIPMVVHTELSTKSQNVHFERGPNFRVNSYQCILPVFAMFDNITTYEIILSNYSKLVMSRYQNATVFSVVLNLSQSSHDINKRSELCPSLFIYFLQQREL